jgi:transcription initiation factor TFIID subunit 7
MSNIIKLKLPKASLANTPGATASPGIKKLKLTNSQPPTPIEASSSTLPPPSTEKKKRPYVRKVDPGSSKKRAAEEDIISPAAKRVQSGTGRKLSIKLPGQQSSGKISLAAKRNSVPKIIDIRARQRAPPRAKGIGYDSEDSDVEKDPAIQQALVLRMQPGPDTDYLRKAIADGSIGPFASKGDADVSLKFVEHNYRRAVVKIRGNSYAAVLVDLPCIVETMKSFDRKGWHKVADCCQMLYVLGRCQTDEEAKNYRLPSDVDKENYQFAHGLTPPLHYVRKRRWRARPNYNHAVEAEEQALRLLEMDRLVEESGGTSSYAIKKTANPDQAQEESNYGGDYDDEEDADAEEDAIETVEATGQYSFDDEEEEDGVDLEAELAAQMGFAEDDDDELLGGDSEMVESPLALAPDDGGGANSMAPSTVAPTPADTPTAAATPEDPPSSNEDDSGSDEDDDEDDMDVFDEDAAAKSAERAQQLEEVADLEQEIARTRQKAQAMTNQLLKTRELRKLAGLEEDLKAKKVIFGLEEE